MTIADNESQADPSGGQGELAEQKGKLGAQTPPPSWEQAVQRMNLAVEYLDAVALPDGIARWNGLQNCLLRAIELNDEEVIDRARTQLLITGSHVGKDLEKLALMAQRLQRFDERGPIGDDPAMFERVLVCQYRQVVCGLADFPSIARDQLLDALRDFERRAAKFDPGREAVFRARMIVHIALGNVELATEAARESATCEPGAITECHTCTLARRVHVWLEVGRYAQARNAIEPFLTGTKSCAHQPARVFLAIARPMFEAGERELAMDCWSRGSTKLPRDSSTLGSVADEVALLAGTENHEVAERLLNPALALAWETQNPADKMKFFQALRLWLVGMKRAGKFDVRLETPPRFPLKAGREGFAIDELAALATTIADETAQAFDRRNGNSFVSQRMTEILTIADRTSPCPLPERK